MSSSDCLPDYPLSSDLVQRLKSALDARDEEAVGAVICTQVGHVDAVIELANDDWLKDPAVQLPPGVLLGNQNPPPVFETELSIPCACGPFLGGPGGRWERQMMVLGRVVLLSTGTHAAWTVGVRLCHSGNHQSHLLKI